MVHDSAKQLPRLILDSEVKNYSQHFKRKEVSLSGGCFDILHAAHLLFLEQTQKLTGFSVVFLESDSKITRTKGPSRPKNTQDIRANQLLLTGFVDCIILLTDSYDPDYYGKLIDLIKPKVIAITRGDPITSIKRAQAEKVGAKLIEVMPRDEQYSTTKLINQRQSESS